MKKQVIRTWSIHFPWNQSWQRKHCIIESASGWYFCRHQQYIPSKLWLYLLPVFSGWRSFRSSQDMPKEVIIEEIMWETSFSWTIAAKITFVKKFNYFVMYMTILRATKTESKLGYVRMIYRITHILSSLRSTGKASIDRLREGTLWVSATTVTSEVSSPRDPPLVTPVSPSLDTCLHVQVV